MSVVCLTLSNAAAIHHHIPPGGTAVRGYTSTAHHGGHLTPGDQWRPLTRTYFGTWGLQGC